MMTRVITGQSQNSLAGTRLAVAAGSMNAFSIPINPLPKPLATPAFASAMNPSIRRRLYRFALRWNSEPLDSRQRSRTRSQAAAIQVVYCLGLLRTHCAASGVDARRQCAALGVGLPRVSSCEDLPPHFEKALV